MGRSRRNSGRSKSAKPASAAPARPPLLAFTAPEHDPLSDSRLRPLVERYAALVGARVAEVGPQLLELDLPDTEREFFGGEERVLIAFTVAALERSPDAEMAVVGSPFVDRILEAVRAHGARIVLDRVLQPQHDEQPALGVAVRDGASSAVKVKRLRHAVGRLLARVIVRAGPAVEEHLLESRYFDFATGAPLPPDVSVRCAANEQRMLTAGKRAGPAARTARSRPYSELVDIMVRDLEIQLAVRLDALRSDTARTLAVELERIDSYYHRMLQDVSAKGPASVSEDAFANASRVIEAEHARRRLEEERRHQVRAVVHPLQLVQMSVQTERARWRLTSTHGDQATVDTIRYVVRGAGTQWRLVCPTCRREPGELVLRADGKAACAACS